MTEIEILQKYDEAVSGFAAGLAAGLLDPDQEKSFKEQYELFKAGRAALRRIAEDDKARDEGLLVRLPCKQYTAVYYLLDKQVFVGWYLAQVGETTHLILQDRIEMGICWITNGAWFLTRQEAEAALGGGEGC